MIFIEKRFKDSHLVNEDSATSLYLPGFAPELTNTQIIFWRNGGGNLGQPERRGVVKGFYGKVIQLARLELTTDSTYFEQLLGAFNELFPFAKEIAEKKWPDGWTRNDFRQMIPVSDSRFSFIAKYLRTHFPSLSQSIGEDNPFSGKINPADKKRLIYEASALPVFAFAVCVNGCFAETAQFFEGVMNVSRREIKDLTSMMSVEEYAESLDVSPEKIHRAIDALVKENEELSSGLVPVVSSGLRKKILTVEMMRKIKGRLPILKSPGKANKPSPGQYIVINPNNRNRNEVAEISKEKKKSELIFPFDVAPTHLILFSGEPIKGNNEGKPVKFVSNDERRKFLIGLRYGFSQEVIELAEKIYSQYRKKIRTDAKITDVLRLKFMTRFDLEYDQAVNLIYILIEEENRRVEVEVGIIVFDMNGASFEEVFQEVTRRLGKTSSKIPASEIKKLIGVFC